MSNNTENLQNEIVKTATQISDLTKYLDDLLDQLRKLREEKQEFTELQL